MLADGFLNDFHQFDPSTNLWTLLDGGVTSGTAPAVRGSPGFTYTAGRLYLFGGIWTKDDGRTGTSRVKCAVSVSVYVYVYVYVCLCVCVFVCLCLSVAHWQS